MFCAKISLILFLFVYASVAGETYQPNERFFRLETTKHLLHSYIKENQWERIVSEDSKTLCARKFVVSWASPSCNSMGNRFNEAINDIMIAIISNRTYAYRKESMNDCEEHIIARKWVPRWDLLVDLLIERNCIDQSERKNLLDNNPNTLFDEEGSQGCCGTDEVPRRFVRIQNGVYHDAYWSFHKDSGARLRPDSYERANRLFRAGSFESAGLVMQAAFAFGDSVRQRNKEIIAKIDSKTEFSKRKSVIIGVHLRHRKLAEKGEEDFGEESCLLKLVEKEFSDKECIVLIASDRPLAIERIKKVALSKSCNVYVAEHDESTRHKIIGGQDIGEHGFLAAESVGSIYSISDWYLLSHADVLIANSPYSTFSWIIANNVVLRSNVSHPLRFGPMREMYPPDYEALTCNPLPALYAQRYYYTCPKAPRVSNFGLSPYFDNSTQKCVLLDASRVDKRPVSDLIY